MSTPTDDVEDRLRRTLRAVAATTVVTDRGADLRHAGRDTGRPGRGQSRRLALTAAAAVVAAAAVGLALAGIDRGTEGGLADDPAGPRTGFVVPTVVPEGWRVARAVRTTASDDTGGPSERLVVHGTRRADGTLDRAIAVAETDSVSWGPYTAVLDADSSTEVAVGPSRVRLESDSSRDLTVARPTDGGVTVVGRSIDTEVLLDVVRSVVAGSRSVDDVEQGSLPEGFELLYDGAVTPLAGAGATTTRVALGPTTGAAPGGWEVVAVDRPVSPEPAELLAAGASRRHVVAGREVALYRLPDREPSLPGRDTARWEAMWEERPGLWLVVRATSPAREPVLDFVAGLEEVTEEAWRAFVEAVEPP